MFSRSNVTFFSPARVRVSHHLPHTANLGGSVLKLFAAILENNTYL